MGTLDLRNTSKDKPLPLRVAVYGPPKVGKTWFASTFPKPFFISVGAEGGVASLAGKDIDYALVNTQEETLGVVKWFVENYEKREYGAAVIDTATVLGRVFQMKETNDGTTAMEHRDWMRFLGTFLGIRDRLHTTKAHVVWVFHPDEVQSGGLILRIGPKLAGQALKEILSTCGIIAYLTKDERSAVRDGDKIVKAAETVRSLWVRCPAETTPKFEAGTWYDEALTEPCYVPHFDVLKKYLAPKFMTP